jgi:hypothetical protein
MYLVAAMINNLCWDKDTPLQCSGTEHAIELAVRTLFTPTELRIAQVGETYGFFFCHVLVGGCKHCALWTRLDILMACLVLAQYQADLVLYTFALSNILLAIYDCILTFL